MTRYSCYGSEALYCRCKTLSTNVVWILYHLHLHVYFDYCILLLCMWKHVGCLSCSLKWAAIQKHVYCSFILIFFMNSIAASSGCVLVPWPSWILLKWWIFISLFRGCICEFRSMTIVLLIVVIFERVYFCAFWELKLMILNYIPFFLKNALIL